MLQEHQRLAGSNYLTIISAFCGVCIYINLNFTSLHIIITVVNNNNVTPSTSENLHLSLVPVRHLEGMLLNALYAWICLWPLVVLRFQMNYLVSVRLRTLKYRTTSASSKNSRWRSRARFRSLRCVSWLTICTNCATNKRLDELQPTTVQLNWKARPSTEEFRSGLRFDVQISWIRFRGSNLKTCGHP